MKDARAFVKDAVRRLRNAKNSRFLGFRNAIS